MCTITVQFLTVSHLYGWTSSQRNKYTVVIYNESTFLKIHQYQKFFG